MPYSLQYSPTGIVQSIISLSIDAMQFADWRIRRTSFAHKHPSMRTRLDTNTGKEKRRPLHTKNAGHKPKNRQNNAFQIALSQKRRKTRFFL